MKWLITGVLIAAISAVNAQVVRGYITGDFLNGTRAPLPGAALVWQGTRHGTVTNEAGYFELSVPQNVSTLIISYTGFTSDTIAYSGQENFNIVLKEGRDLGTVTIEEDHNATEISLLDPLKFQTLGQKELCKAACCNLSESFETNASIDASFTDAITGARQIRMLGLDGRYSQIMFDNVPAVRGLASTYGLTYVPGPWINSIQIAKGAGSVLNGFESITGQINVAYKNPNNAEPLHVNAYGSTGGRMELNVVWNPRLHREVPKDSLKIRHADWGTILLVHGAQSSLRSDMNNDGFLDNPLFTNLALRNEWTLATDYGFGAQYAIGFIHLDNVSGKKEYDPADEIRSQLWGVDLTTDRYEFSGKMGYVFPEKDWKSIGSQISLSWHDQEGNYGFRDYSGQQLSARVNLLFSSRFLGDNNKYTIAFTSTLDEYDEHISVNDVDAPVVNQFDLSRTEKTVGLAFEDSWSWKELFTLVVGLRGDVHNEYGFFLTPRIHARYSLTENSSVKIVAGKGYRTANMLMDNVGLLAGNREFYIPLDESGSVILPKMEEAWNAGILFTTKFKLSHRDASLTLDVYRTEFQHQVIADIESPGVVHFFNLQGRSYSSSVQGEFHWSPVKRLEWRLAYRWMDARTDYIAGLLERPLVNRHRAFTNVAYATKENDRGAGWRFDATLQWVSRKRIPQSGDPEDHIHTDTYSDPYFQLHAQVTYIIKKDLEIYVGGENLTNFMQHDAIILSENPSDSNFDASLVWGPVFGRMGYVGMRWTL